MILLYELNRNDDAVDENTSIKIIRKFNNETLLEYYRFYNKLEYKDSYDNFVLERVEKEILKRMKEI